MLPILLGYTVFQNDVMTFMPLISEEIITSTIILSYSKTIYTLNKVQKILPFFGKSENSDQSFIMGICEKMFRFFKCLEETISCSLKY